MDGIDRDVHERRPLVERLTERASAVDAGPVLVIAQLLWFTAWIFVRYTPTGDLRSLSLQSLGFGGFTGRVDREPDKAGPARRAITHRDKGELLWPTRNPNPR